MEPVDEYVLEKLWAELDKPEFLDQLNIDGQVKRRDEIGAELTAAEGRRRTLAKKWAVGDDLTDVEWQEARREIAEHEQKLRNELAAIPPPLVSVNISTARQAWPDMTLEEKREFLSLFIDHVTIAKGWRGKKGTKGVDTSRIDVEWKHRMSGMTCR